ncbi:MAG: hypothetical protein JJE27_05535 [Thermoleophilia bacterium]|nr:hypothetical protein [Thermoleophilia bacterium]
MIVLFASTFKPWFKLPGADVSINLNVWDLSVARWFVYLALIVSAWMVIAALLGKTPRWALVFNTPALLLSFLAAIGVVVRLINPPDGASVLTASWVAAAGVLLLVAGTSLGLRDDTVPDAYLQSPPPEHLSLDA